MHTIEATNLYESMYEYANDADITHYVLTTADEDPIEILILPFYPSEDKTFVIRSDININHNGNKYIRVYWGENEESYIIEHAIWEYCYIRYVHDGDKYVSDGRVYETEDDANKGI